MTHILEQLNAEYTNELCDLCVKMVKFEEAESYEEADAIQKTIVQLIDNTSLQFHQIGGIELETVLSTFKNNYNDLIQYIRQHKDKLTQ